MIDGFEVGQHTADGDGWLAAGEKAWVPHGGPADFYSTFLRTPDDARAAAYDALVAKGLKLDLTRGKPAPAQLDLSNRLLTLPDETVVKTGHGDDTTIGAERGNIS